MLTTQQNTADLLHALQKTGVTLQSIADELEVNWRTVYRWSIEETHPQPAGIINRMLESKLQQMQQN